MKKLISIIIAAIAVVIGILVLNPGKTGNQTGNPEPSPATVDTSKWKKYRNEELGFELKYPEEWHFSERENTIVFNDKEIFFAGDTDLVFPITIAATSDQNLGHRITAIKNTLKLQDIYEATVTVDGISATRIEGLVTGESLIKDNYYVGVFFNHNSSDYGISYSQKDKYYLEVFDTILASFNIIK